MRLSYCGMEIDISLEGLLEVEYLEWHEALNSHGQVNICFLAEEEQMEDILFRPGQAAEITVSEQTGEGSFQRAFCGKAVRLRGRKERGLFFLQAEFAGFTKEWDLVPGSRSFCRTAQPYGEVLREVIREYPERDIRDEVTGGKATGAMLLQYEETDWEFLKRLAGHFSSFLVADSTCSRGRVYFGLPVLDYGVSLQYGEYRISRNRDEYDRISRSRNGYAVTDLLPQELSRWTIRCRRRLHLAETVRFCGVETVVSELEFHTEHGELVREYTLCRKAGLMSRRAGNPAVAGMSLPATVKERSGNQVRVHMDIDREYCGGDDCAYFTYAIESSSIYCMPEVGSRVHIYFPGPDEAAAVAVHAISTGAAAGRNPADKSFSTPAGMSMDLNRDSYRFDAGGSCLSIGTDGTVRISGTRIRFTTQGEFSVGKAVQPAGIQAEAENGMHLHVGDTSITMTENTEAVSGFIAHMAAKKRAPSPSAESIEQEVKAGDGALLASFNQGAEAHLRTMADQQILAKQQARAEEQIRRGAMGLAGFVLVTGLVVASGGLAAAALGTAAAAGGMQASLLGLGAVAAFMGTNTFMGAAAELHQGVTDYNRALEGEISSTGNLFQTALGMNDRSYAAFMAANNLMYQSVTMTASTANLFSRMFTGISGCTARQLARSGTMFAVQTGKSVIDQYGATGRIDLAGMLVDGGIGAVSASAGGLAGKYALRGLDQAGLKLPLLAQLGIQSAAAGVVGGTADFALHLPLAQGMVTASDLANTMIMYAGGHAGSTGTMMILDPGAFSIGDPVSAITGAYTAVETDLAVAGIRSALVWERKYDSLRQKSGILGKGWYSPLEGRLCRKEDGDLQVEIPAGAVLLFGQVDGGYKEAGEARGRYGLKADTGDRKWVLTDFHTHEKLEYDQEGRLTAMADAGGRRTLLHYEQGTLACLVTPLGHRLYFVFREGRLVQASDDIGRTVRYHYEGGLLAEVVNPAGGSIRYRYSGEGRLITASDCAGSAYLANEYDRQGRVIRQFLGDREVAALEYRDDRGETAVRTRYGTAVFRYSRMKLPVRILYPDGTDLCFRYDSCHRCIYRKDRRGNTDPSTDTAPGTKSPWSGTGKAMKPESCTTAWGD